MFRKPYDLHFSASELLGSDIQDIVEIVGIKEAYEYEDNKNTGKVIGHYYTVKCPDGVYLRVKILGEKLIDEETIKSSKVRARFINLVGKSYVDYKGRLALSCTATGLEVINE